MVVSDPKIMLTSTKNIELCVAYKRLVQHKPITVRTPEGRTSVVISTETHHSEWPFRIDNNGCMELTTADARVVSSDTNHQVRIKKGCHTEELTQLPSSFYCWRRAERSFLYHSHPFIVESTNEGKCLTILERR